MNFEFLFYRSIIIKRVCVTCSIRYNYCFLSIWIASRWLYSLNNCLEDKMPFRKFRLFEISSGDWPDYRTTGPWYKFVRVFFWYSEFFFFLYREIFIKYNGKLYDFAQKYILSRSKRFRIDPIRIFTFDYILFARRVQSNIIISVQ